MSKEVVRSLLPVAVAVAVSPVPVLAVIVMLLSPRAGASATGFLAGWIAGILLATGLTLAAVEAAGVDRDNARAAAAWLQLSLGVLLLAAGIWLRLRRKRPGGPTRDRIWMAAIGTMTPVRGAGLGLILSAVNPKNLTLCVSAGITVAAAHLTPTRSTLAVLLFTSIAASAVALPVIGHALRRESAARRPRPRPGPAEPDQRSGARGPVGRSRRPADRHRCQRYPVARPPRRTDRRWAIDSAVSSDPDRQADLPLTGCALPAAGVQLVVGTPLGL